MKISAVIPTYNRADTIGETLESIFSQTLPVSEIVIIDDGSTDNTASVIKAVGSPLISYHRIENSGVEFARGTAIRNASHEWIAPIDSDDIWEPDHIERLVEAISSNPGTAYAFSNFYEFGSAAKRDTKFNRMDTLWWPEFHEEASGELIAFSRPLYTSILNQNPIFTTCSLYSKELYEQVGGIHNQFSRTPAADAQLVRKCALETTFACDLKPTVGIRKHGGNFSSDSAKTNIGRLCLLDYERRHEPMFVAYAKEIASAMASTVNSTIMGAFSWRDFATVREAASFVPFSTLSNAAKLRLILSHLALLFKKQ